jgi:hypothetical protein
MTKISVSQIESDVPIPVRVEPFKIPLEEMEVGQSIAFDIAYRPAVQTKATRFGKRAGKEFTVRKVSDTQCRVWRTK